MADEQVTLGQIATIFRDLRDMGVTRAYIMYAVDQVYWEDVT